MLQLRAAEDRGHANYGWLDTNYSFSFNTYYDPRFMGYRALRVINEDRVAPGQGFGTHPHDNMEILTYVLEGAIEHRDSLGTGEVLTPGEVQYMSAGTGIRHSEFNPSKDTPLHLLQIWLLPNQRGLRPGYEQKRFPISEQPGRLHLVASTDGRDGSIRIHSDAELLIGKLGPGTRVRHDLRLGGHGWLQVAHGAVAVAGERLKAGDGLALSDESAVKLDTDTGAELLLFDLA
jgi:redox-sensitive bicupin YhaK (pirin superfamily)